MCGLLLGIVSGLVWFVGGYVLLNLFIDLGFVVVVGFALFVSFPGFA